eukprot:3079-Heterococcus_DN1.PRE.5
MALLIVKAAQIVACQRVQTSSTTNLSDRHQILKTNMQAISAHACASCAQELCIHIVSRPQQLSSLYNDVV